MHQQHGARGDFRDIVEDWHVHEGQRVGQREGRIGVDRVRMEAAICLVAIGILDHELRRATGQFQRNRAIGRSASFGIGPTLVGKLLQRDAVITALPRFVGW